ncbi:MAG: hypothetical protein M3P33_00650 [bacterium]|nr:hypothetical protein [bacterium]
MKQFISMFALILVFVLAIIIYKITQIPVIPTHNHANFAIFENNNLVDYSDIKYMDIKPCRVGPNDPLYNKKQDNIHLHNNEGKIVHAHQDGITWADLFIKLKYNLTDSKKVHFYLNKNLTDKTVLNKVIKKNETLMLKVGDSESVPNINQNEALKTQYDSIGEKSDHYNTNITSSENCSATDKRTLLNRLKIAILVW